MKRQIVSVLAALVPLILAGCTGRSTKSGAAPAPVSTEVVPLAAASGPAFDPQELLDVVMQTRSAVGSSRASSTGSRVALRYRPGSTVGED